MRARSHVLGILAGIAAGFCVGTLAWGHGSAISPESRVHRVYASNPENPSFQLAKNAVQIDGTISYYTWTELSRNIPAAVNAGLPPGFDYSPWVPNGQFASGGRVNPNSTEYPRTYAGLDQVSAAWPTSPAQAGAILPIRFDAHTPHDPSVWDVWMTTADWLPTQPLNWNQMQFLGRPSVTLTGMEYNFNVQIPANRSGHHVLWIAWQRNDPAGEVFFSTSDLMVSPATTILAGDYNNNGAVDAADYVQWRNSQGAAAGTLPNDVDGGVIGSAQYARWRANFGTHRGTSQESMLSVPEPGTLLGVLIGLIAAIPSRRAGNRTLARAG